jgi:hypothetical protein
LAKDFRTYTIIFLRQEKTLRDHNDELPTPPRHDIPQKWIEALEVVSSIIGEP